MAKTSLIVKQKRLEHSILQRIKEGQQPRWYKTRYYNRCSLCWAARSYIRDYGICRWCFIKYARLWLIMWVKKSSR